MRHADRQTVARHYHISHPPPDSHTSLIDSLSDTFINAFSRVRKPDARFIEMAEGIERYEEGLTSVDRLVGRSKQRVDGELLAGGHRLRQADAQTWLKITWTWRLHTKAWATSSQALLSRSTASPRKCSTSRRSSSIWCACFWTDASQCN